MPPAAEERPTLDSQAWVAPNAMLLGDVSVGARASVWYAAVIRADQERITVGSETNIQDGAILHADPGLPLVIGDRVSVGHGAVLHGCTVGDDALVGMRATVLNGARIGTGCLIAAGSVVLEGADIPPRSLVAGVPGRVRRETTEAEAQSIQSNAENYLRLAEQHAAGAFPPVGGA